MQNTLLGLAIAIIVALVAALIGPHFVEWSNHRAQFEAVASRLVGLPVRVSGPIDVRLLPTPSLQLGGIEIGPTGGTSTVRAKRLAFELALGPLMRGKFRAAETHLAGAEFHISVNQSGGVDWPAISIGFDPDSLSIDHLNIEDGRAVFIETDSGARVVLDQLSFDGEVRSLAGSFKGDGGFVSAGALYGYRIAASRVGDEGGLHLRLGVYPTDPRLLVDADGTLSLTGGSPRFDGTLSVVQPADAAPAAAKPNAVWRANAHVSATPALARFDQAEFQYGSEERPIKLSGTAELGFGNRPRFTANLSGRQLDLDRAIARPELTGRPPLAAIEAIAATFGPGWHPPLPVQLSFSFDAVTFGGTNIATVRGDVYCEGEALNVGQLEFRAPGASQVQIRGRLDLLPNAITFAGPVRVDSNEPRAFTAWLAGRTEPTPAQKEPLQASGDVTLASDRLQIEGLKLGFQRESVDGRLAYRPATPDHPARLEAELRAPALDVDAAQAFLTAALGGTKLDWPGEMSLAVAIGRATIAGTEAHQAEARLRLDRDGLHVDRLALADFGGASFELSGDVDAVRAAPRGRLILKFDARDLSGVAALLTRYGGAAADPVRRLSERWLAPAASEAAARAAQFAAEASDPGLGARFVPAKLYATLDLQGDAAGTKARLAVNGQVGAVRISRMTIGGEDDGRADAQIVIDSQFDAENGSALATLFGLDRLVVVGNRPARLNLAAKGRLNEALHLDSRIAAAGLNASAKGTLRLFGEQAPTGSLKVTIAAADARPLRRGMAGQEPLPVALTTQMGFNGNTVTFEDLAGKAAGASIRGQLAAVFSQPIQLTGSIETDAIDASAALAAAIGLPVPGGSRSELALWSPEPFGPGFSAGLAGAIKFKAARAKFSPTLVVQQSQALLRFGPSDIAIEDLSGTLAGGRLASALSIHSSDRGLAARTHITLTDADVATLIGGGDRPPVSGRLALSIEGEGEGLSPIALIGSITGGGTIALDGGQLAGLGPKAFAMLTRAVDQGAMLDAPRIRDIVSASLDSSRFDVRHLDAPITVTLGQVSLGTIVKHDDADLAVNADLDLSQARLNARLILSRSGEANAAELRPDVLVTLKGPVAAPQRTLDVSSLASWLTLRAVERQTQRLEVIEASRRENEPKARGDPPGAAREDGAPSGQEPNQVGAMKKEEAPAPSALPRPAHEPPPMHPAARTGLRRPSPAGTPAAALRSRPKPVAPPRPLLLNPLLRP